MDGVKGEPMAQDNKLPAPVQKYVFAPYPSLFGNPSATIALSLRPEAREFLGGIPVTKRPRSLQGEMDPSEITTAPIADRQAHAMGKMEGPQKIRHSPQARKNAMGGTANAHVEAMGAVLKEVDIQTQRRHTMPTTKRAALVAAGKKSIGLDSETDLARQDSPDLNRHQQQVREAAQHAPHRRNKEGMRAEQTTQNQKDFEMQQLRMEMNRLKSDMVAKTAQTFAATTQTGAQGYPVRGTRTPQPPNPTTINNVR